MVQIMKLHVGCGKIIISGYVNIDIHPDNFLVIKDDVRYLNKFEKEKITEIYACHILEHFPRKEIKKILKRWYNLLQPNGVLLVCVPDFEMISNRYQQTKNIKELNGGIYGAQDCKENFHYHCWDFNSLKKDLEKVGFVEINRYNWKESISKDLNDASSAYFPPMRKGEDKVYASLNVRAVKL